MKRSKNLKNNTNDDIPKPDDLDWSYIFSNNKLTQITKTTNIVDFCKTQHLKYIAHVTTLGNDSYQKQILFSTEHKKYTRDRWLKFEKDLSISKTQIQKIMQNKKSTRPY